MNHMLSVGPVVGLVLALVFSLVAWRRGLRRERSGWPRRTERLRCEL